MTVRTIGTLYSDSLTFYDSWEIKSIIEVRLYNHIFIKELSISFRLIRRP